MAHILPTTQNINIWNFNARPLLREIQSTHPDDDFLASSPIALPIDILDSSALMHITSATLKNLSFCLTRRPLELADWKSILETRVRYLEAGLVCLASLVSNVVFAGVFGALNVLSLCQLIKVRALAMKYFTHAGIALASIGVAFEGTIQPRMGLVSNLELWGGLGVLAYTRSGQKIAEKVSSFYRRRREYLQAAMLAGLAGNQVLYQASVAPIFSFLDRQSFDNIDALSQVVKDTVENYPFVLLVIFSLLKEWGMESIGDIAIPQNLQNLISH